MTAIPAGPATPAPAAAPPTAPAAAPQPAPGGAPPAAGRHRLTALTGLAALSLDALASVAYGPEAIVLVLAAAGARGLGFALPVTLAVVALLAVLVASYRQVIAAFPDGGGSYAVAGRYLGRRAALVAAASLILDYVLNVAVAVTAGVAALTSAVPSLHDHRLALCLAVLTVLTAVNLRGIADAARALLLPTAFFVVALLVLIAAGLCRDAPVSTAAADGHAAAVSGDATTVGVLLLLKAFASGCSALTGVEALANAVPSFRAPAVRRARRAETALGALLGALLIGLAVLISRFGLRPVEGVTVLAQLADAALGHHAAFYAVQGATTVLLALSANTSFGGLPVLLKLLARDNYVPHVFGLRADRQGGVFSLFVGQVVASGAVHRKAEPRPRTGRPWVGRQRREVRCWAPRPREEREDTPGVHRHGILALAVVAAALLIVSGGDTNALVPLFAIGVFVGFTLAQAGMVRHWRQVRGPRWRAKAVLGGLGAALTGVSAVVTAATKFADGAWLIVVALPLLVAVLGAVHRAYARIGDRLGVGRLPDAPHGGRSLVVVPVGALNRLTREALSAAACLGDEVRAVTVCHPDPEDRARTAALLRDWHRWDPGVALLPLHCARRTLGRPVAGYVRALAAAEPGARVTVLIPEAEPDRLWHRLLQNQRGALVAHAVRRDTDAAVCRLRIRLTQRL
ncbi:APC family permease [Streptomyces ramulosus]|uniref:APC family permease n=1 Tax=Streptomyces ramulosus TaxID=47762 RepID=A0ABW1FP79_9ACTN